MKTITKTEAIKTIKAMPGLSAKATGEGGEMKVWLKAQGADSAYFTDAPLDAVSVAKMRAREIMEKANKPRFTVTIAKLNMSPAAHRGLTEGETSADGIYVETCSYTYSADTADEANAKALVFHAKKHWAVNHPFSITKTIKVTIE